MHNLRVTVPGQNMLQEKDQSTFPPENLQDSQCLNYHEPLHSAMLPHLTAMGDRNSLGSLMTTTSAPWEPLPCPWTRCFAFFLCAYSPDLWLVWVVSGLTNIQNPATPEWVIDKDRKKGKKKTREEEVFPVTARDSNNLVPTLLY